MDIPLLHCPSSPLGPYYTGDTLFSGRRNYVLCYGDFIFDNMYWNQSPRSASAGTLQRV